MMNDRRIGSGRRWQFSPSYAEPTEGTSTIAARRRGGGVGLVWASFLAFTISCVGGPTSDAVDTRVSDRAEQPANARCALPSEPVVAREDGPAVLLVWRFPDRPMYEASILPEDDEFLAYRAAVQASGGDIQRPSLDHPEPDTPAEAEVWEIEHYNNEMVYDGRVGRIEPITCLDALFFAYQNARVPQLDEPTEFLVSVLRKDVNGQTWLTAIFGAGDELFPPRSVWGLDVVDEHLADGWRYWYVIHNHTLQRNGEQLKLGVPVPSGSDVQLMRGLVADRALESVRVTNGFYTSIVMADELDRFQSR